jgi:hypothetical protein
MPNWLRSWLDSFPRSEPSRVIVGSTGSGKSEGELVELLRLARREDHAVVLLDGHGPLALNAAGHWAHHGYEQRIIYEPLDATDRVLCWNMFPKSSALDPVRRSLDDAETRDDLVQCFLAPRDLLTIADKPWTKEWLDAAIALGLSQPHPQPLPILLSAFRVGTADYERLLHETEDPDVAAKFRGLELIRRRNPVQYETLTGASRRLLELICSSEVIRLRSRPGPFDWLQALQDRKLLALDGGGVRSRELKRAFFLLVSMQVIHAVRRHFALSRQPLPVVLVLEEAGAMGLVTPFVLAAFQELRKAGLAIHVLTQSSLDFGDPDLFERILGNSPWQAWYQVLAPADQELGAKVMANAAFDSHAVHFTRPHLIPKTESMQWLLSGESWSGESRWRWFRHIADAYYKSPQLQEQEYRTRLATLRIGERLVRDRKSVRRERVKMLRPPALPGGFELATRSVIERIRQQPIYLPAPLPTQAPKEEPLPDAAERLRALGPRN